MSDYEKLWEFVRQIADDELEEHGSELVDAAKELLEEVYEPEF